MKRLRLPSGLSLGVTSWCRRHSGVSFLALLLLGLLLSQCRSAPPQAGPTERGIASWYGHPFHGRRTANGERYDMEQMTAAHRTLPFGSLVEVHNLDNHRRAVVRINDRGPFAKGRIIDLSRAAARQLAMIGPGTARVELRIQRLGEAGDARQFVVQVGAFRERQRAAAVAAELRRRDYDVAIETAGGYFRVRLGPLLDRQEAASLRDELAAAGYSAILLSLPSR